MTIYVVLEYTWDDGELTSVAVVEAFENAIDAQCCRAGGRYRHIKTCELKTKQKGTF
jgi:hypothetical protein